MPARSRSCSAKRSTLWLGPAVTAADRTPLHSWQPFNGSKPHRRVCGGFHVDAPGQRPGPVGRPRTRGRQHTTPAPACRCRVHGHASPQGPHPATPPYWATAGVTSWCQVTFQLDNGVLSNRRTRTANGSPRTCGRATGLRGSRITGMTEGSRAATFRTPPRSALDHLANVGSVKLRNHSARLGEPLEVIRGGEKSLHMKRGIPG